MKSLIKGQRGIAMVVVLLVAASLTVVASTAAFMTIEEFRAGGDDRRAAQALAYAEAGIDRAMQLMKGGKWGWSQLASSGCNGVDVATFGGVSDGAIGNGYYTVEITPDPCQSPAPLPSTREAIRLNIISVGEHPTARRVIQQTVELRPKGVPIGIFAAESVSVVGTVSERRISLITPGTITNRNSISFIGKDPYYKMGDFFPGPTTNEDGSTCAVAQGCATTSTPDEPMPAGAHAGLTIGCSPRCPSGNSGGLEHATGWQPNCQANNNAGGALTGQSAWDSSSGGATTLTNTGSAACLTWAAANPGTIDFPPTARFSPAHPLAQNPDPIFTDDEERALKNSAKTSGLYCSFTYVNATQTTPECTAAGVDLNCTNACTSVDDNEIGTLPNNFVAWFDFPEPTGSNTTESNGHIVNWNEEMAACNDDPALNHSVIVWIENGSLGFESGRTLTGAIFALDGLVFNRGNATLYGTVIAKNINMRGGADYTLDECWLRNMPIPFYKTEPISWTEIDR